jgi:hypothetical protein
VYASAHAGAYAGDLSVTTKKGVDVATFAQDTYTVEITMGRKTVRKTPTWAIILGIIGLFLFLLGALLFLVKENRHEDTRILTVTLTNGQSFTGPYVDGASYK